jgi:hypothetical protein
MRPRHDEVVDALKRCGCFLGPTAMQLGVSRSNLQTMIKNSSRLSVAFRDMSEGALDVLEGSLWKRATEQGDVQAARIILNARGRSRGYGWQQPGDPSGMGDTTSVTIQHVTINAIESGKHFAADDEGTLTIEGSVDGEVRDDRVTEKLS